MGTAPSLLYFLRSLRSTCWCEIESLFRNVPSHFTTALLYNAPTPFFLFFSLLEVWISRFYIHKIIPESLEASGARLGGTGAFCCGILLQGWNMYTKSSTDFCPHVPQKFLGEACIVLLWVLTQPLRIEKVEEMIDWKVSYSTRDNDCLCLQGKWCWGAEWFSTT